jgi:lipoic acid synthetase
VKTIEAIKALNPGTTLEVLIPDFREDMELVDMICKAAPNIISHNMETVRRLTPLVRSAAKYDVSLSVLNRIAKNGLKAKSGMMVGLGETTEEILELMNDLLAANCSAFTIGQYLQPSRKHLPVASYMHPDEFKRLKEIAMEKGFCHVESGPLVRSSYHAENCL